MLTLKSVKSATTFAFRCVSLEKYQIDTFLMFMYGFDISMLKK